MMGQFAIFRNKSDKVLFRLTPETAQEWDRAITKARGRLAGLYEEVTGKVPGPISQADAAEFLIRGVEKTRAYLRKMHT